jgi:hypothetical protein
MAQSQAASIPTTPLPVIGKATEDVIISVAANNIHFSEQFIPMAPQRLMRKGPQVENPPGDSYSISKTYYAEEAMT